MKKDVGIGIRPKDFRPTQTRAAPASQSPAAKSKAKSKPTPVPGCACCARLGWKVRKPLEGKRRQAGGHTITKDASFHCRHAGCESCHHPKYKEMKYWRRFGIKQGPDLAQRGRAEVSNQWSASGCTSLLVFRDLNKEVKGKTYQALRRSKRSPKFGFVELANGTVGVAVPAGWEDFVRKRVGRREDGRQSDPALLEKELGEMLESAPVRRIGGNGVRPVAITGDSHPTVTPASSASQPSIQPSRFVTDLTAYPAGTPEELAKHELYYPNQEERVAAAKAGLAAAQNQATGSNIDGEAAPMVPWKKEDEMPLPAEHTELLRQIAANTARTAANTAALPEILRVLKDYDEGRIDKDERDRRIKAVSRLVN